MQPQRRRRLRHIRAPLERGHGEAHADAGQLDLVSRPTEPEQRPAHSAAHPRHRRASHTRPPHLRPRAHHLRPRPPLAAHTATAASLVNLP